MKPGKYKPPPIQPPPPAAATEPWEASPRKWLDVLNTAGQAVVCCDGWGQVHAHLATGAIPRGLYRVVDARGRSVATIAIDSEGDWEIWGSRARSLR